MQKSAGKIFVGFIFLSLLFHLPLPSHAQSPYVDVTAGASKSLPIDYLGQNAANIIQIRSLTNKALRSKIPLLQPATIRHVASSQANWWDWRSGWLLQQKDVLPGYTIRDDWAVLDPLPDKISDFKYLVDTTGASAIYAPNVLTSRLDYQVAALFEFANQNILAPRVEMGSEFYLDNFDANMRFPTSLEYADTATVWIAGFKSLFPNAKVSCIGATEQGNSLRRNTWTQNVVDHTIGYDAISVKVFLPTGLNLSDSVIPKSSLPDLFANPFKTMEPTGEVGKEIEKLHPADEMWISEYNLTDQRYAINGHWAHGLFEAALTLSFLSNSRITHINQFRMSGDALHGDMFETDKGFDNGPAFVSLHPNLATDPDEFTAIGNAMLLVGNSLRLATAVSPLIFTPQNGAVIQQLTGGYLSLCGYKITKPFSDEMILLNLSDDSTLLHVQQTLDGSIVYYEILWWPSDTSQRPMIEITGDMPVVSGTINNGQIYIPPYSIMRLYQKKNEIYAQATDDTICGGSSTTILAYGADQYSWNPAVTTMGDQAVAYVTPVTTTTYTVTGTQGCTGPGCTKSITIHVFPKPVQGIISATPSASICPETPVALSVQQTDANKFCWTSPDVGSQFGQSSITVTPFNDTTTYYLFGAKDGCYSYRDSITIYIRPSANAGPDLMACAGDSLLIGTPSVAGLTYTWSPTLGLSDPDIAQPLATPDTQTTYILTVTDPAAGCSDKDTLTIDPLQCCQGSVGTPVFPPNTTASVFLNTMFDVYNANGNQGNGVLNGYPGEIIINGAFIVDTNLSIFNCPKIRFGEKARIYVTAPNLKLKLENDSLQSCGSFAWSGIVNTNVLSKVVIDNCFIANADTVLLTKDDADYEIRNSFFHDNLCGVRMVNYVEELEGEVAEGSVYGTIFEGDFATSTGISAEHVNIINIGEAEQAPNIFRNMYIGVSIYNGNANILNNQFLELQYGIEVTDTFSNPNFAPEYTATIGGDGINETNSFEKISVAILGDYVDLDINEDSFINCEYGVWVKNCISRSINISKNFMTAVFKGVNIIGNRSSSYVIKNNTITTTPLADNYFPVAIQVTDLSNAPDLSGSLRINDNEINCIGLYGILISNNNGYGYSPYSNSSPQVSGNIIHLTYSGGSSRPVAGIRLENCLNNVVGENTIEGAANAGAHLQGIQLFDVTGTHFFCNLFDTLGTGIVFIGTNKDDSTWSNIFLKADTGLKVGQSPILYGKLNDQSGNTSYTAGNQFQDATDLHLVNLDTAVINYFTGNNELFPPLNAVNFMVLPKNLTVFSCQNTIAIDSTIVFPPDLCADTSAAHATILSIVQQFPVNGTALIDANELLLWQVANTCPLECGEDIFIARGLLRTKYDNLVFNDDSLCLTQVTAIAPPEEESFSYYPNPVSELLTIEYSFADNEAHDLIFSDLSGRVAASYKLFGQTNKAIINTSELSAGCYLLSLYRNKIRREVDKLIIAK